MNEIDMLIGKAGEPVPVVDVADLKAMWTTSQELKARHAGVAFAIGAGVFKAVCKPGADILAVAYRRAMLEMLERTLRAAWNGGELSENAFKVAARMDLNWPQVGVVQKRPLVELEDFLAEVQSEAA